MDLLAWSRSLEGNHYDASRKIEESLAVGRPDLPLSLNVLFEASRAGGVKKDDKEDLINLALKVVQRNSQSSVASAVTKLSVRLEAGNDKLSEVIRKEQQLATETDYLEKNLLSERGKPTSSRNANAEKQMIDRLAVIAKIRGELQLELSEKFPYYSELSDPVPLEMKEIRDLLRADEAVVVFAIANDRVGYVLAVTESDFDWKRIEIPSGFSQKVAEFRKGLDVESASLHAGGQGGDRFDLAAAHSLYKTLFGPTESLVKDKKNLLIVPSGALTALPFHLLVTEPANQAQPQNIADYRDAEYLLKRHATTVLPSIGSLRIFRKLASDQPSLKKMIGFGDPVFDPSRNTQLAKSNVAGARKVSTRAFTDFWRGAGVDRTQITQALPQLPDTADELLAVAKNLGVPSSDIHLGSAATETRIRTVKLDDYSIIYFATHGLVSGDIKGLAEPSLAMSMPRQASTLDDGLLTASEIAQLKLNADWVVLSACNTIAGDKPGAEALSGLARAFFFAGARALLVTHWAVDSAAATRLTVETFGKLSADKTIGRSEALRRAMMDYLADQSSPRNAHPAFWGAFVVIGDNGLRYSL